jgi:large subunit ribosomal protein L5
MAKDKGDPAKEKPAKDKPAKEKKGGPAPEKGAAAKGAKGDGAPVKKSVTEPRLSVRYKQEIVPALQKKLGRENRLSLPRLQKISVNMGVGKALQDKNRLQEAADNLAQITGQKPQVTKARVAISGFRLREGNEIGCRVTLRRQRMYEFLDRLISVALPRIRDFRGVNPKSFDGHGNYTFGLTEQLVFPEIDADKVNFTQGMDITLVTSTDSDDEARELLRLFGMPFREA